MPSPLFRPLRSISAVTLPQELALLQAAETAQFAIAPTFVAQSEGLRRLAESAQIFDNLSDIRADGGETAQRLRKKITSLPLPTTIAQELHQLYHQLGSGYVRLRYFTLFGATDWSSEIKGDVNLGDSLLALWAGAIELNLHHHVSLNEAITNCQVELQAQPSTPVACGSVSTQHPETGEHHWLVIQLWPGAPHPQLLADTPTQYTVDVRTGLIVQRTLGLSKQRAKRTREVIALEQLPETAEFPDEAEVIDLAERVAAFKRKYHHPLSLTFEIAHDELWLTAVAPLETERRLSDTPQRLLTKVYLTTGSAQTLDLAAHDDGDGLGLLKAEHLFSRLAIHPLTLVKRGRSDTIVQHLGSMLKEAGHQYPHQRVVYRLQNFTSQELRALQSGESQEKTEPNPYLGWRGGLRLMEQPSLFEPELAAFDNWLKHRHAPTGLMVPFVRSTAEWRWIINRWKERHFFDQPEFENWFQVTTPENVANLEQYVLDGVHGLSVNLRTLTALTTGTDPDDPELQASYPPPIELQQNLLSHIGEKVSLLKKQAAHAKLRLHLHLEDFNHQLVQRAVMLRYDGIVLPPSALAIGRSSIAAAEREWLQPE